MEGFISSIISGFSHVVGKLLGHPLDFLAGKSCNTKCQPIWDVFCYIENFCISHLLKLILVIVLLYFILLFFYLSFKLGICQCICRTCCRSIWACFGVYFYVLEYCCSFLCLNLEKHNQRRRIKRARDIEEFAVNSSDDDDDEDWEGSMNSSQEIEMKRRQISGSRRTTTTGRDIDIDIGIERRKRFGCHAAAGRERKEYLRRSLRPKHHRILVRRLSRGDSFCSREKNWIKNDDYYGISPINHITLSRSSKFAQKRGSFRRNKNVNMILY